MRSSSQCLCFCGPGNIGPQRRWNLTSFGRANEGGIGKDSERVLK
jgi:hypothetical protein